MKFTHMNAAWSYLSRLSLSLILMATIIGCTRSTEAPELVPDRSACSTCNMLISETEYAAAFSMGDAHGDASIEVFDDIGCMLQRIQTASSQPTHVWVRDLTTDRWIDGATAAFVHTTKIRTPMSFGYVAYAGQTEADASAERHTGTVIQGWKAVMNHYSEQAHAAH